MGFDESFSSTPLPSEASLYTREFRKWDRPRSQGGMRPDRREEFPQMVFKAAKRAGGPFICVDPADESFSTRNQLIVGNQQELDRARDQGWRLSPQEAIDYALSLEDAVSMAAAERIQRDKRMGEAARVEAQAADDATADHLPEIPEKRRGRPRKNVDAA